MSSKTPSPQMESIHTDNRAQHTDHVAEIHTSPKPQPSAKLEHHQPDRHRHTVPDPDRPTEENTHPGSIHHATTTPPGHRPNPSKLTQTQRAQPTAHPRPKQPPDRHAPSAPPTTTERKLIPPQGLRARWPAHALGPLRTHPALRVASPIRIRSRPTFKSGPGTTKKKEPRGTPRRKQPKHTTKRGKRPGERQHDHDHKHRSRAGVPRAAPSFGGGTIHRPAGPSSGASYPCALWVPRNVQ